MKDNRIRRFMVMTVGLLIMGLGLAFFKVSFMGNDPHSAMVMALADKAGLDFSVMLIIVNCLWFAAEVLFGRKYIGVGTVLNWFGVGVVASACINWLNLHINIPQSFLPRAGVMLAGILTLSLAASMYQTANLGIAPYDVISILISERFSLPYFGCRVFTDAICAVAAFMLGGIVGLGTLICAVGLGPFISFFNTHISEKLCEN